MFWDATLFDRSKDLIDKLGIDKKRQSEARYPRDFGDPFYGLMMRSLFDCAREVLLPPPISCLSFEREETPSIYLERALFT
jgi:hypothetical protein